MSEVAAAFSREPTRVEPTQKITDPAVKAVDSRVYRLEPLKREIANRLIASKKGVVNAALAVNLLVGAGCGNIPKAESPSPTPTIQKGESPTPLPIVAATTTPEASPPQPPKPEPILTSQPSEIKQVLPDGTEVVFDKSREIPIKYVLPNKKEVLLDQQKVREARDRAIQNKEPEIIETIEVSSKISQASNPSPEHPTMLDKPKDVLSDEELEKKGVKIIQAINTKLFIREGAFAKGSPLAAFNNTGRKLTIALVDGPLVATNFLKDTKYDPVRGLLLEKGLTNFSYTIDDQEIEKYRIQKITSLREDLNEIRQKVKELRKGDTVNRKEAEKWDPVVLDIKTRLDEYENLLSNDQLVAEMARGFVDLAGKYFPGSSKDPAVVYVAVGTSKRPLKGVQIYYDSNGRINITQYESHAVGYLDFAPKANQTHPNPADFRLDPSASPDKPRSYPYVVQSPGQVLLHELAHDELMTERFRQKLRPNISEYDTDMRAMQWIKNAWERWKNSGYKDDSGYPFVISLPDGGYILH